MNRAGNHAEHSPSLHLQLGDNFMGEISIVQKPLLEQILDEMFLSIEKQEEFDAETIEKLKKLATSGDLRKANVVIRSVSVDRGETL